MARLTSPYDCNIYFGMFHAGKGRATFRAPFDEEEDRETALQNLPTGERESARQRNKERKRETDRWESQRIPYTYSSQAVIVALILELGWKP